MDATKETIADEFFFAKQNYNQTQSGRFVADFL